jgi:nucleotide-binding universal stress UspA family protein
VAGLTRVQDTGDLAAGDACMFEKILFPTDFSSHAQAELECLAGFPEVREIVLLHIVKKYPIPMIEELVRKAMQGYLDDARAYLHSLKPGIAVTIRMETASDVAGSILDAAVTADADLIVISGFVRSFKADVLLHRVPATVLCRASKTNVLVMPNRLVDSLKSDTYQKFCTRIFSRVLCPTDFSELSSHAIACAGRTHGVREVLLLHVLSDPAADETGIRGRLAVLRDSLAGEGVRAQLVIARGDPAKEIARVAEEEDVSLIWMSTSGKGCLAEFLSGSLVHDVMMNGKRPVLIVRSAE